MGLRLLHLHKRIFSFLIGSLYKDIRCYADVYVILIRNKIIWTYNFTNGGAASSIPKW